MKPIILDAPSDGETPPLRWRTFYSRQVVEGVAFGLKFFGSPEWAVHLYLGWWLIGVERTREED